MRKIYRVYVLGGIPSDLKERIDALHASAIVAQRKEAAPGYIQNFNLKNGKKK
jgi:hypothetical protein